VLLRSRTLDELTIDDERSFRGVALYAQLKEVLRASKRRFKVAELIPPREGRGAQVADAFLAEAVRQGWLTAPALRADRPPPRLPVAAAANLLAKLADDRADR
jgi:hypothetical protein